MILNLHRMNTENIGDIKCSPTHYFNELKENCIESEILGFKHSETPNTSERALWEENFNDADSIIIGGGGLLEIDFFEPAFEFIYKNKKKEQKIVFWGAGHNQWKINDWRTLKHPFDIEKYPHDLAGIRDFNYPGIEWVPCSSCLSEKFDKNFEKSEEIVLYVHEGTLKHHAFKKSLPENIKMISNSTPFDKAVEFLGSSELVLTDSFHGAYWATLLNCKVIAFPSSSKFYGLKHSIPLCSPLDWQQYIKLAVQYPSALYECRESNRKFSEKVFDLIL